MIAIANSIDEDFASVIVKFWKFCMKFILKRRNHFPVWHKAVSQREKYSQSYVEIYQQDTLPEPMTMLRATAEANNLSALASAQEKYTEHMDKVRCPFCFWEERPRCAVGEGVWYLSDRFFYWVHWFSDYSLASCDVCKEVLLALRHFPFFSSGWVGLGTCHLDSS